MHAPVSLYKAHSDFGAEIQNERSQPDREFRKREQLSAETTDDIPVLKPPRRNGTFFDTWSRAKQTDMLIMSTSEYAL